LAAAEDEGQEPLPGPLDCRQLREYWRQVWDGYESALRAHFPEILKRVLAEAARHVASSEAVLYHLQNAGWLFQADGRTVAMDVALLDELNVSRGERSALFTQTDVVLYTHQHADHCHDSDLEVLAELGEPPVVCHPDTAEKLYRAGVPEKQVVELEAGRSVEVAGVGIRALAADHRSQQVPNAIAPAVTVGGVTVVHAGDNRLFAPPSLRGAEGCDVLIHSLYAYDEARAEEGTLTWVPELLEEQARFLADLRPETVLIAHLGEFRHPYHKRWRFQHAGVLKELLFALAPEIACPILAPGESYIVRR